MTTVLATLQCPRSGESVPSKTHTSNHLCNVMIAPKKTLQIDKVFLTILYIFNFQCLFCLFFVSNFPVAFLVLTVQFFFFRMDNPYAGRPIITYRDLDAPRDYDEF